MDSTPEEYQERVAWSVLETYFAGPHKRLTQHQLESFNEFMEHYIPLILSQYDPVHIFHNFDEINNRFTTEIKIYFSNVSYARPVIQENNGSTRLMTPESARLRGLMYSVSMYADVLIELFLYSGPGLETVETQVKKFNNIEIGKIPIMLHSRHCILSTLKTPSSLKNIGESQLEQGGYFIINGSEKVIVSQERQAENKIYCFKSSKTKCSHIVEIKSASNMRLLPAKLLSVKITTRPNSQGHLIFVTSSHFRQDIPVAILFRALGVSSDKEITKYVFGEESGWPQIADFFHVLRPSLLEVGTVLTQDQALEALSRSVLMMGFPKEIKLDDSRRIQSVRETLANDVLPHLGTCFKKKAFFLGMMVKRLILYFLGFCEEDDRDAYSKKRVDTPGILLANLTRQYITKMIKEMRNGLMKEMNIGNWRYTKSIDDLINVANIYKIIKSSTVESGLRFCLSTGNWGLKNFNVKVGVAQVVNRLSFNAMYSHLRRLNTPIDKTSKLTQPRKLHASCWGFVCPSETPEGGSIGGVKNMSLICEITSNVDTAPLLQVFERYLHDKYVKFEAADPFSTTSVLIFLNGDVIGFTKQPFEICDTLRKCRRNGTLHMHTSVTFIGSAKEIHIQTDAGRVIRPVFRVSHGKLLLTDEMLRRLENNGDENITWHHLVSSGEEAVVEYLDAQETETVMICSSVRELHSDENSSQKFTHCEIHPSLIFGAIASTIPFSNHNQSPRNTYQSAMSKQSMGIYASNYRRRMDTITHVLGYPTTPLVYTKAADFTYQEDSPNGSNVIVAIMMLEAYNIEDSVNLNSSSVDLGMYVSTAYRTHKDETKTCQISEDESFCKPDPKDTRGMKTGSYDGIDASGAPIPEHYMDRGDIVIGKSVSIKQPVGTAVSTTAKPFRDQSTTMRYNESGMVDRVIMSYNGDGCPFIKVRTRSHRVPEIGDKFSSRHGQKGTVGMMYRREDMPFSKDGLVPDIIINPHAIPSRMTIAQLAEVIMGKLACASGRFGDGTPFTGIKATDLGDILANKFGMERHGNEVLYNGKTGEQLSCDIFMGPTYYQRLKHLPADKIHSRSTGPRVKLTRQPAEGRARDGGLRVGEMERDCGLGSGALQMLNERLNHCSDAYKLYLSKASGLPAAVNHEKRIYNTFEENDDKGVCEVILPYGCKLLFQELYGMAIKMEIRTEKV